MIGSDDAMAIRGAGGRWFVSSFSEALIRVYGPKGQFLQVVGRRGQGPGEFGSIDAVRIAEDGQVWVFDQANGRASVYSADLELAQTIPMEVRPSHGVLLLPGAQTIVSRAVRTPELIGYPLHWLDNTGTRLRSFGEDTEFVHPGLPGRLSARILAHSRDGGFWSGNTQQYLLAKWSLDGTATTVVRRKADWFPTDARRLNPADPIQPTLIGLQEDAEGLLWCLIAVPDPGWDDQVDGTLLGGEPRFVGRREDIWDTRIEIIDLASLRILASVQVPERLTGFVAPGLVGSTVDVGLDTYYQVRSLGLDRRGGG